MPREPLAAPKAMEEEDEEPAWLCATSKPKTLNEDPFNVYAEELAMEVCHSFRIFKPGLYDDLRHIIL